MYQILADAISLAWSSSNYRYYIVCTVIIKYCNIFMNFMVLFGIVKLNEKIQFEKDTENNAKE